MSQGILTRILAILVFFHATIFSKAFEMSTTLRSLCNNNDNNNKRAIILPGVHDSLSAKIFTESGAQAIFLSGFGVSASRLGCPDAGILTLSEMEDTAKAVINSTGGKIPVIVDGDTGYGGAVNIRRTVRGLASVGAAAVTIEDQVFPKRCTYAAGAGVRVVSRDASLARVRTAIAAREEARDTDGRDLLIVARTDCRAALGVEEAIARCRLFEEAGADIVYAENLQSRDEYAKLRNSLDPSTTMMMAQVQLCPDVSQDNRIQFLLDADEIGDLGYRFALFGITALQATTYALQMSANVLLDPQNAGLVEESSSLQLSSFSQLKKTVGFPDSNEFESQYGFY